MPEGLLDELTGKAVEELKRLIAIPSVSRDEQAAADEVEAFMKTMGLDVQRRNNNVWAVSPHFDESRPTVLLNAHIDTVKPVATWTRNPFEPSTDAEGRLYGLGSNDCGGGLMSLLQVFGYFVHTAPEKCCYNLVYLASAEEEVSGRDGIESVLPLLPEPDVAIVGEPTGMQPAIAEKGLMVIDAVAHGKSGHAARNEGVNAIYVALDDINWIRNHRFDKVSDLLGPTKMTVTIINAGTQHNVVPDECRFTIDVRSNEHYTNHEIFEIIGSNVKSELKARSFRLGSSRIDPSHPLIQRCLERGLKPYGSPTLSDQALMHFPSFKLGPGESARSHSADEFIFPAEIRQAIDTYIYILSHDGKVD